TTPCRARLHTVGIVTTSDTETPAPRPRQTSAPPPWLRTLIPLVLVPVWLGVFAVGGSSFSKISQVATNDQAQHLPASAEATTVQELQAEFRDSDLVPAVLVYERATGLTDADKREIERQTDRIASVHGVEADAVSPPIFSEDGQAAEVFVPMDSNVKVADTVEEVRALLAAEAVSGLDSYVTGPAGLSADIVGAFSGIDGLLLIVALAAVLLILVIVYRSPLLPLIVLATSM